MSWQPDPTALQELITVLRDSTSPDSEVQRRMAERLDSFQNVPGYIAYLAHIIILCPGEEETTRSVAGLILKNTLVRPVGTSGMDAAALAYVKSVILRGMADPSQTVRQTVGTVIVNLMVQTEDGGWPEGLEALMRAIDSTDENEQEGAFNSLVKLAEDGPSKLDCEINGQRPINYLMERFLAHTEHPNPRIRVYALTCIKHYLYMKNQAAMMNIDNIMQAMFRRASDSSSDVRGIVCQCLSILLTIRPDKLLPEMTNVAEYMLYSAQDQDETVALEASEFWLTFGEDPSLQEALRPWLPKVAPLLLSGMVYSQSDLDWLGGAEDEDEAVPDKESDIKPRFHGAKSHAQEHEENASNTNGNHKPSGDDEDEDGSEYDYEEDEDDEDMTGEWNLRKCSAAALDVMSVTFGNDMLEILLPYLKERLFSDDWLQKESGILALGAIAEGCMSGVRPHLPQLMPFLVTALSDPKPLVRSITCWTIGRYSAWACEQEGPARDEFFVPVLEGLLRMVLDSNKRVQEAGCSAFATLEEEAGAILEPYLEPVLRGLVTAFGKYQQKNLLILYDAIGTLADSVGSALARPEYLQILMPSLIDKWVSLSDENSDLVPLLECLSSVTIAAGHSFAPYAHPVFERCLHLVQTSLVNYQAYQQNPDHVEEPEPSFVVVALDLLSGLCQGLGVNIVDLVQASDKSILQLMTGSIVHPEDSIRQSALALLGDLAIAAFPLIQPHLAEIMPAVIGQIEIDPPSHHVSVCNNATWAIGEIALQHAADATPLEPFVAPIIERLVPILCNPRSQRSLSENAAVTIGRIGLVCPAPIAPHLEHFAKQWCTALWEIKDNDEKDSAFRGFCMLIQANPAGIQKDYLWFCNAVCKWQRPSPELNDMFHKILAGFKQMLGDEAWNAEKASYPAPLVQRLQERYGV
ncbi:hypothetical protein NCC49_000874 [Naganishia albida]|nr:hypothetical protein NCC49_000874 [Naganishia albida]